MRANQNLNQIFVVDTKLSVAKAIDTTNNYKLDVGGDVNFTGNLYQNGTFFSSGGASLTANNTRTGLNIYNTSLPTSTLTPTLSTELIPKSYVDNNYSVYFRFENLDRHKSIYRVFNSETFNYKFVKSG